MKEWSEIYNGHKLLCTPIQRPDGSFGANLIVQKNFRYGLEDISVQVIPDTFSLEEDAANAARIAGRMWVDDNE